jgi:hypothetical protein
MVNRNLPAPDGAEFFAEGRVKNGFFCPEFDASATV